MTDALRRLTAQIAYDELPLLMQAGAGTVAIFDVIGILIGSGKQMQYLAVDALVLLTVAIAGLAIQRRRIPSVLAPWTFAICTSAVTCLLFLEAWRMPGPVSLAFPALFIASYQPATTSVRPVMWTAPWLVMIGSATAWHAHGSFDPDWTALLVGAGVTGAVLLRFRMRLVARLAEQQQQNEQLARRDALTGVLNRRGFDELVRPTTAVNRRQSIAMFAAFIDIDGLKAVNDTAGHDRGDEVIRRVALAIQSATRPGDLIVRFGGDEFIVIGPGDAPDADALAERIAAHAAEPSAIKGWIGTVSVGVHGAVGGDIAAMISAADDAMYERRRAVR